ncbi:hypothetical protein [Aquisphaera insulae]|uniref:hypothetical protein n=1 Tax=Aquisphaera insulae TaxID=2712864 RepID=UPI0013E9D469|nr:hypothetical protein [Aquisphaera insulae]
MKSVAVLLSLVNGYKTYSSVILAVVSGLGMILSKNYSEGAAQIFQALLVVFSGTTVVSMRHAVSKAEAQTPSAS